MRCVLVGATGVVILALLSGAAALADPQAEAPAAQLRGVLLGVDGMPATGYQIGLKSAAGDLFLAPPSGPDGSFVISGLPAGSYTIVAFSPDGAEFPVVGPRVDLTPGQVQRMEVRLKPEPHAPGRDPEAMPRDAGRRGDSWLSRIWHRGTGEKIGVIAVATLGTLGLVELFEDDERQMSPSNP